MLSFILIRVPSVFHPWLRNPFLTLRRLLDFPLELPVGADALPRNYVRLFPPRDNKGSWALTGYEFPQHCERTTVRSRRKKKEVIARSFLTGGDAATGAKAKSAAFLDFTIAPRPRNGGGSDASSGQAPVVAAPVESSAGNDWLNLIPQESSSSNGPTGLTPPWHPAARQGAGQAISTGGGGAPAVAATRGAITPLKLAPPSSAAANPGASAALFAAAASAPTPGNAALPHGFGAATTTAAAPAAQPQTQPQSSGPTNPQPLTASAGASGGTINPNIDPTTSNFSPASLGQFQYFPVYL